MALVMNCVLTMMEKKNHKADAILIAALVLAGAIVALALFLTQKEGACVEVRVSGRIVERVSLHEDLRREITGADGGRNLLIVENGEAWIEEADCPDALCKGMGRIHLIGQSVVCLPHEVVVEIVGEAEQTGGVDLVAG